MKALFKNLLVGGLFIFMIASPVMAVTAPQTVSAANCEARVLGIPPWYRGLTNSDCSIKGPEPGKLGEFVWKIVLNGIEMAIVLMTYVTVFFILYGGFLYITGGALPGQLEKARKTILNAIVGLVICMAAIGLTNLVFSIIT